jgi:hypothetical protein
MLHACFTIAVAAAGTLGGDDETCSEGEVCCRGDGNCNEKGGE